MKKYGKYERMPDGTRAKQPAVKSMLLQTYFTGLICLVLCVSMFFGTTFAWFTSEVNNTGNEIYIGTLDVGLEKFADNKWVSLDPNTGSQAKLFDDSIKWEPGYTALETIRVTNEGELSFRYALTFTNGTIENKKGDTAKVELLEAAEHFVVYVHEGAIAAGEEPGSFADIEASAAQDGDGKWRAVRMGKDPATLADILKKGFPVLSGNMEEVLPGETDPTAAQPDYSNASNPTEQVWTVALHMDAKEMSEELLAERLNEKLEEQQMNSQAETKTEEELKAEVLSDWQKSVNAMMGHAINMNVKLTAYQRTHEDDAFNAGYDLQAHVTKLGQLPITYRDFSNWNQDYFEEMTLDTAYQFQPVESTDEVKTSPYKNYIADFVIWADKEVKANSMVLAGYYDAWCSMIDDHWIALKADFDVQPGEEIHLVKGLWPVTYKDLCDYGNDGIGFLCGAKDVDGQNVGTTITVELRLYEVDENGDETEDYIVAGRYAYTFE